jgi:hypothetical protein
LISGREAGNVYFENLNIITSSTNVVFRWCIFLNPTFNKEVTYTTGNPFTILEYNVSTDNTYTITGGVLLLSGYGVGTNANISLSEKAAKLSLGTSISGVSDVLVLAIQRLDNQTNTFYASMLIRESV